MMKSSVGRPVAHFQRAPSFQRSVISQLPPMEKKCSRLKLASYSPKPSFSLTRASLYA
jgi:hypothetical protein